MAENSRTIGSSIRRRVASLVAACALALPAFAAPSRAACPSAVAVQILGSGGPIADDARASAGYLLWIDGEARLLVDIGGGVFLRFAEAKARFESLDAIALTHLHADHVGDLPALLKSGFFSDRERPLPILGPTGGGLFPGIGEFMQALFDSQRGAFRYLSGYLDGSNGLVRAEVIEIEAKTTLAKQAFANERFTLAAVGVEHGPVPALGFLVEVRGKRIAFAGDQNGDNPAFAALIKDADLLIMDHAIDETSGRVEASLHARPSEIAALASTAQIRHLVLSHNMARSLGPLGEHLKLIRARYAGPVTIGEDLMCLP